MINSSAHCKLVLTCPYCKGEYCPNAEHQCLHVEKYRPSAISLATLLKMMNKNTTRKTSFCSSKKLRVAKIKPNKSTKLPKQTTTTIIPKISTDRTWSHQERLKSLFKQTADQLPKNKDKPFKCLVCGSYFVALSGLRVHFKRLHAEVEQLDCPLCTDSKSVTTSTTIKTTITSVHSYRFVTQLYNHIKMCHSEEEKVQSFNDHLKRALVTAEEKLKRKSKEYLIGHH